MEGKTTEFAMQPLTRTDLVSPLSRVVQEKHPKIDLLVAVVGRNETNNFLEISIPLAAKLGHNLEDTCCVSSYQLGPKRWKVLTTHGNAHVLAIGEDFEVSICQNHEFPRETPILRQLADMRNELLSQSRGLSKTKDIRYPEIRGNVLLCGDFSIWNPISLLALRKIFFANRANDVIFVTPVMDSGYYRILAQEGCNVICLRPSEEIKV